MPDTLLLIALAVLPFAGTVAAGLLPTHARNAASGLAGAVALACLGLVWAAYPTVSAGGVLRAEFGWMPMLGLNLTLRMDGFAWLFAGLVTGIGTLVVLLRESGSGKEVYRARVDKPIDLAPDKIKATIDEVVREMFAKYPTRTKK